MKKKLKMAHRWKVRPYIDGVVKVFFDSNGIVLDYGGSPTSTPMNYLSIFELTTEEMTKLIKKAISKNDLQSVNAIMQCAIKSGRKKFCKKFEPYFSHALATLYGDTNS